MRKFVSRLIIQLIASVALLLMAFKPNMALAQLPAWVDQTSLPSSGWFMTNFGSAGFTIDNLQPRSGNGSVDMANNGGQVRITLTHLLNPTLLSDISNVHFDIFRVAGSSTSPGNVVPTLSLGLTDAKGAPSTLTFDWALNNSGNVTPDTWLAETLDNQLWYLTSGGVQLGANCHASNPNNSLLLLSLTGWNSSQCSSGPLTVGSISFGFLPGQAPVHSVTQAFADNVGLTQNGVAYNSNFENPAPAVSTAPEPATLLLFGSALVAIAIAGGLKSRKKTPLFRT